MRIDVLTVFPGLFHAFLGLGMVGVARRQGQLEVVLHDLRDWTSDRHRSVDDTPYGGGPGMVMRPEPLVAAIEAIAGPRGTERKGRVVLLSPQGERFTQDRAAGWAEDGPLVLVCGRYEGIDQRVIDLAVDEEVSIGDYVLSGGEVPAMAVIEAVTRLVPGVLGNPDSAGSDSFQDGLLEGPQYTRPAVYRGSEVPEVLRSGDHAAVERWRENEARKITECRRPDLIGNDGPTGAGKSEER